MRLDEICELNMGQSPNSSSYNENGNGIPFFQGNADFGILHPTIRVWCNEPKKIAHEGDILISVRAPIGALNIANTECCIGRGLAALTVNKNICTKEYIWYALNSKVDELNNKGTGSTFKAISKNILAEIEIDVPELTEQEYISSILDNIISLINKRKQQLKKLDELVKSRFIEMFGDLQTNSKGLELKPLSELILIERGGSPRPIEKYITDSPDGVNWIKIGDAAEGSIYITQTKERIIREGTKKSRYVQPGDFLLSNSMSFGRPYILTIDGYIHDGWLVLRDNDELFNKLFLHTLLSSDYAMASFGSMAAGSVVKNLNKELVGKLRVPVPDIALQTAFAAFVEQTDKSKFEIQKSLEKLELLKKALMQKYFG